MRRRALSQTWTLSRIHRLLRPLRTKVSALAATLRKEKQCRLAANLTATTAPTPTPTRLRPPLRRTYQTRKRKRGDEAGSDEDGQYLPKPVRVSKPKHKSIDKQERKWSPDVVERVGAVVDAFRVLADVVYDEQVEADGVGGSSVLSLRDMCVRAVAEDIEPSAIAAVAEECGSDDDGELVDATKVVDERFEEIPEHLRRVAIIPYALSMIKQHIDTISPLPQLWNHILAICLSSSAASSTSSTADVLQVCSNLFLASLRQPRSNSRGLASVYRNVVGSGPDKIPPELFCRTILSELVPLSYALEDDYTLPADFLAQFTQPPGSSMIRSPMKTPLRLTRGRTVPPTPPTYDPFSNLSDDPTGALFPIRAVLSRPVAHLVAELGPAELLAFVETTAVALLKWVESDEMVTGSRLREHRADALFSGSQKKMSDVRSLAPRVCARIADWTAMALTDVWNRSTERGTNLDMLSRAALAIGRVVDAVGSRDSGRTVWVDVGDPFCALACVCIAMEPINSGASSFDATLSRLALTARNCGILAGTLAPLDDHDSMRVLKTYIQALTRAQCPHFAATLVQLVLHEQGEVDTEVEELLEDAEARWDALESEKGDNWRWARGKWRWDEITNTWVESSKTPAGLEYVPRATKKMAKKGKKADVIMVSSDTEGGQPMDEDEDEDEEDDVFAAIPAATKYAMPGRNRPQGVSHPRPRPRPRMSRMGYNSSDAESDTSFSDATVKPKVHRQASFLVTDSHGEEDDAEYESSAASSSDSDSDSDSSDFDWEQYNGRYHPHDRVSGAGVPKVSQPVASRFKEITRVVTRKKLERRTIPVPQPAPKPARVVSAPVTVTVSAPARVCAPSKRTRLVVELPLLKKRPSSLSNPIKPRVLGNHNSNAPPKPRRSSEHVKQTLTPTLSPLCRQFSSMSSDDDREIIDVDEVVEGTENEDEDERQPRMDMPSSDDMDLFQIVTPAPRRVRSIGGRG